MLVFGGNDGSACLGDLHVLNVETWTWSQPETSGATPAARCGHSGTLVNKLWFVIGGVGDAPNNAFNALELNDVWVLDTEAWAWWRPDVNPVLPPLAYHTAALTGDKIFLTPEEAAALRVELESAHALIAARHHTSLQNHLAAQVKLSNVYPPYPCNPIFLYQSQ